MNNQYFQEPSINKHSNAWIGFIFASFGVSAILVVVGIYHLPADIWIKGFLSMGILMMLQNAVSLTKTIRDLEEGRKIFNKLEDVKNERTLTKGVKLED